MTLDEIERILIIGAGTMGQQIALQCAVHGYAVMVYDVDAAALPRAQQTIARYAASAVDDAVWDAETVTAAQQRIRYTSDPAEAAQDADLVSESAPEDPALKGQIFGQFNGLCPPRTIFTTNTSTLLPSMFAQATGRPAQFAALHFHQPVWVSNVVDVMGHPGTAPETMALLEAFARRIGQIPIVLEKENPGYVFNTLLNALTRAAMTLTAGDVASVEDVDRAWMGVMRTEIGPFGILDLVGLDTAWKITDFWAAALNDAQLRANADWLKSYIDDGRLGIKSGRGFYTYPRPAFREPDFLGEA